LKVDIKSSDLLFAIAHCDTQIFLVNTKVPPSKK